MKFERCLCTSERCFDLLYQNVFNEHWHLSAGYISYLLLFISCIFGYCFTIANYDRYVAFNAACILFGLAQVI